MAAGGENVPLGVNSGEEMLPCEFCEKLFPMSDIIRHQSGCDTQAVHHSRLFTEYFVKDVQQSSNIQDHKMHTQGAGSIRIEQSLTHDVFDLSEENDGSYLLKTSRATINNEPIPPDDSIQETKEIFECPYCDATLTAIDLVQHVENCDKRIVECQNCRNDVLVGESLIHSSICTGGADVNIGKIAFQSTAEELKGSENYELSDDDDDEKNEYIEHFVQIARLVAKSQDRSHMKYSRGIGV